MYFMYFAIFCFDEPGTGELRETTRPAHLAYLKKHLQGVGATRRPFPAAVLGPELEGVSVIGLGASSGR